MQMPNQPIRVLIVDDNLDAAQIIAEILNASGIFAVSAGGGIEAIQIAPFLKPQVIFLDIQMPGMDGFAVLRALRKLPEVSDARFIALSSLASVEIADGMGVDGFHHHLQKPATIASLLRLIN